MNAVSFDCKLSELAAVAGSARTQRSGGAVVAVHEPAALVVHASKNGQHVILGIRLPSGLDHQIALAVEDSKVLAERIRDVANRHSSPDDWCI